MSFILLFFYLLLCCTLATPSRPYLLLFDLAEWDLLTVDMAGNFSRRNRGMGLLPRMGMAPNSLHSPPLPRPINETTLLRLLHRLVIERAPSKTKTRKGTPIPRRHGST